MTAADTDPLADVKVGDDTAPISTERRAANTPEPCWRPGPDNLHCNRAWGHPGQHIACGQAEPGPGVPGFVMAVWPSDGVINLDAVDSQAHVKVGDPTPDECHDDLTNPTCPANGPRGFLCTRPPAHPGQHIAGTWSYTDRIDLNGVVETWPQDGTS